MGEMPRPRPPYLQREFTRHGKAIWYFRKPGGPRIRIRADFGTAEFDEQYQAALTGSPRKAPPVDSPESLAWLWSRFTETGEWSRLKLSTRRARANMMAHVLKKSGHLPYRSFTPADILASRDARKATPTQAKIFLVLMRSLFRWAVGAELLDRDPTANIKAITPPKTSGFPIWTEEEVERYEARWPTGTRERVWLDVLLYTGLRRGDAVRLGRQHVKDGIATIRTEKSQEQVTVIVPILPILARTLEAGPTGDLAFICGARGQPLVKAAFGNAFREACNKAGVFGKSAHGLRKAGATRAADNGATVTELEAIFGWQGGGMASLYTRAADRKRAAIRAMEKLQKPDAAPLYPNLSQGAGTKEN